MSTKNGWGVFRIGFVLDRSKRVRNKQYETRLKFGAKLVRNQYETCARPAHWRNLARALHVMFDVSVLERLNFDRCTFEFAELLQLVHQLVHHVASRGRHVSSDKVASVILQSRRFYVVVYYSL